MTSSETETYRLLAVDDEAAVLKGYSSVLTPAVTGRASSLMGIEAELFGSSDTLGVQLIATTLQCVSSGHQAVEAVRDAIRIGRPYSVIFIDVRMPPGITGVDAAAQIRDIDPDVEIVFVTGYADFQAEMKAIQISPIEKLSYVEKPVGGDQLWDLTVGLCHRWSGLEPETASEAELLKKAGMAERFLMNTNLSLLAALSGIAGDEGCGDGVFNQPNVGT